MPKIESGAALSGEFVDWRIRGQVSEAIGIPTPDSVAKCLCSIHQVRPPRPLVAGQIVVARKMVIVLGLWSEHERNDV